MSELEICPATFMRICCAWPEPAGMVLQRNSAKWQGSVEVTNDREKSEGTHQENVVCVCDMRMHVLEPTVTDAFRPTARIDMHELEKAPREPAIKEVQFVPVSTSVAPPDVGPLEGERVDRVGG